MIAFKTLATATLVACGASAFAQKAKLTSGSIDPLKGTTSISVRYDYSDMMVGNKNSEEEYVREKTADYNKKETGRGDRWAKEWVADRDGRYEVQFKEEFAKQSGMTLTEGGNGKYMLIVHTIRTEPGFNVGVMRKNAEVDIEVTLVETTNPGTAIATITLMKMPGRDVMGYDFDTGYRLQEAYAKAGKSLGKLFEKELK